MAKWNMRFLMYTIYYMIFSQNRPFELARSSITLVRFSKIRFIPAEMSQGVACLDIY